jgi:hypothetical protein
MKENVVKNKNFAFTIRVVKLYQFLSGQKKEFVLSKQPIVANNESFTMQAVDDALREILHLFMPKPTIPSFQFISFK